MTLRPGPEPFNHHKSESRMAEKSPRGPVSAEKSPRGPVSNGVNGIRKDRFSQKESPRKSITELGQIQARPKITSLDQCKGSFLQSAKENMRKRSFTLAADEMNKFVRCPPRFRLMPCSLRPNQF